MITRFLERLDAAASTLVPVAYLLGLLLGTMSYFAGLTLDAGLAVGVALAIAAELHSFLEQRRVRALWSAAARASDLEVRERIATQLRGHIAILTALVAFSAVNATAFAAETWHPAAGFLPSWLQIGIRGCVVPVFFLLTGALSPLSQDAGDELAHASRAMLRRTVKATVRQWNARIENARRAGVDLAPVAISLMLDAGDTDGARRVELIARGLAAAEAGSIPPAVVRTAAVGLPVRPPTGPGSPLVAPGRGSNPRRAVAAVTAEPLRVLARRDSAPTASRRRAAAHRPAAKASAETRARRVWMPGMSAKALARAAKISDSTASKWHAILAREEGQVAR